MKTNNTFNRVGAGTPNKDDPSTVQDNGQAQLPNVPRGTNQTTETQQPRKLPPWIDFDQRRANRELTTDAVLAMLRTQTPGFYALAEVVGKWVWIGFSEKQPPKVTRTLAQLGFHWNNARQVWQHPCGHVTKGSQEDPHAKYASYYAADTQAA